MAVWVQLPMVGQAAPGSSGSGSGGGDSHDAAFDCWCQMFQLCEQNTLLGQCRLATDLQFTAGAMKEWTPHEGWLMVVLTIVSDWLTMQEQSQHSRRCAVGGMGVRLAGERHTPLFMYAVS
jgi:hypothetical protein